MNVYPGAFTISISPNKITNYFFYLYGGHDYPCEELYMKLRYLPYNGQFRIYLDAFCLYSMDEKVFIE